MAQYRLRIVCVLALCLLVLVVASGCAAPPAITRAADSQVERWRLVRREGRDWTEEQWQLRLRQFAATERTLAAWVAGDLTEGDAVRFRREEADSE